MTQLINKLPIGSKWYIAIKTLPIIFVILGFKYVSHYYQLDTVMLNSIFTALISANIFLISFLISGVLSDFKEAEKLPGEMANCLEALVDEGYILYKAKKSPEALIYLQDIKIMLDNIFKWFHKNYKTDVLMQDIFNLNKHFYIFENLIQPNSIGRLKQEQSALRRIIKRIYTIRETDFLNTGYAITEIITTFLILGLLFIKISDNFVESFLFTGSVSFILIYMINLIHDLDNPFSYYKEGNLSGNVSLVHLEKLRSKLDKLEVK